MKKFFGVFLMVCMLLTSLSVGVSADYALDGEDHVFTFNTADELEKYYKAGNWKLSDGTNSVELGNLTYDTVKLGKYYKKIVLDPADSGKITPETAGTLSIRGDVSRYHDYRDTAYGHGSGDSEALDNISMNTVLANGTDKVIKYTMYAYSAKQTGQPLVVDFATILEANETYGTLVNEVRDFNLAGMSVPAETLYSEDGIPHKIDFIIYYTGSSTNHYLRLKKYLYYEIYIDGLFYHGGDLNFDFNTDRTQRLRNRDDRYSWIAPHIDISSDGTNPVTWQDTEMYICTNPEYDGTVAQGKRFALTLAADNTVTGTYLTLHDEAAISSEFFQDVTLGDFSTERTLRTGFVNGVDSDLATALETSYKAGSQVVTVDETLYNAPASIWGENTSSNVSLVDTKTGDVYGVADAANVSGTFANYLISVNGVYAKVEMEESEEPEDAAITYDAATKTATLKAGALAEGTTLQVVVAAYNANGKVEKVKVSESYTALTSDITYTIDDATFPTDAAKYKVFVFDSLASAKPLVEALEK